MHSNIQQFCIIIMPSCSFPAAFRRIGHPLRIYWSFQYDSCILSSSKPIHLAISIGSFTLWRNLCHHKTELSSPQFLFFAIWSVCNGPLGAAIPELIYQHINVHLRSNPAMSQTGQTLKAVATCCNNSRRGMAIIIHVSTLFEVQVDQIVNLD